MANDYIPGPDGGFHAWQNNFGCRLTGGTPIPPVSDLGLVAGDVADVNAAQSGWTLDTPHPRNADRSLRDHAAAPQAARQGWTTAYPAHPAAQSAAQAARQAKDAARGGLEGAIRPLVDSHKE